MTDHTGTVTQLTLPNQAIVILQPAVQNDYLHKLPGGAPTPVLTGQFYADFGYAGQGSNLAPIIRDPILYLGRGQRRHGDTNFKMEASALSIGPRTGREHARCALHRRQRRQGRRDRTITVPATATRRQLPHANSVRTIWGSMMIRATPRTSATPRSSCTDFTVMDYSGDGVADLGVLSNQSGGLLVAVKGNVKGGAATGSGTNDSGGGLLDAGNIFGPLGFGVANPGNFLQIKSGDFLGGKGVAVLDGQGNQGIRVEALILDSGTESSGKTGPGATLLGSTLAAKGERAIRCRPPLSGCITPM